MLDHGAPVDQAGGRSDLHVRDSSRVAVQVISQHQRRHPYRMSARVGRGIPTLASTRPDALRAARKWGDNGCRIFCFLGAHFGGPRRDIGGKVDGVGEELDSLCHRFRRHDGRDGAEGRRPDGNLLGVERRNP